MKHLEDRRQVEIGEQVVEATVMGEGGEGVESGGEASKANRHFDSPAQVGKLSRVAAAPKTPQTPGMSFKSPTSEFLSAFPGMLKIRGEDPALLYTLRFFYVNGCEWMCIATREPCLRCEPRIAICDCRLTIAPFPLLPRCLMMSSLGSPCPTTAAASGAGSSPDGAPPAENAASPGDEAVFEDYLTDAQSQSAARIAAFLGHRDMPTGGGTPSGLNRTSSVDSTDVVVAEEGSESKVASADVDLVGAPTVEFEPGLFMQVRQVIVGEWCPGGR